MDKTADIQQAVAAAVSTLRPEIIAALQELVRIPSQTGCEGQAQEAVARLMRGHDLDVDVWEPDVAALEDHAESVTLAAGFAGRPNVVGVRRGRGSGRSLILNGHIDTVEVGDPAVWRYAPLGGDLVHGRLYGRGACDMKGGIVANLFALRALRAGGIRSRWRRHCGEHGLGRGRRRRRPGGGLAGLRCRRRDHFRADEPRHRDRAGWSADVPACMCRGSRRTPVSAMKGSAPSRSSPISIRVCSRSRTRRNAEITHPLYEGMRIKAPINIGVVRSGSWASSVPEWLIAEGRAGLVPGEELATFKTELAAEIADASGRRSLAA